MMGACRSSLSYVLAALLVVGVAGCTQDFDEFSVDNVEVTPDGDGDSDESGSEEGPSRGEADGGRTSEQPTSGADAETSADEAADGTDGADGASAEPPDDAPPDDSAADSSNTDDSNTSVRGSESEQEPALDDGTTARDDDSADAGPSASLPNGIDGGNPATVPIPEADAGDGGVVDSGGSPACVTGQMCDATRASCDLDCQRDQEECELTCTSNPGQCRRQCENEYGLCVLDCTRSCDDCYLSAGCAGGCGS